MVPSGGSHYIRSTCPTHTIRPLHPHSLHLTHHLPLTHSYCPIHTIRQVSANSPVATPPQRPWRPLATDQPPWPAPQGYPCPRRPSLRRPWPRGQQPGHFPLGSSCPHQRLLDDPMHDSVKHSSLPKNARGGGGDGINHWENVVVKEKQV